ncbi:hypothetical protein P154DRAFT_168870 [Amniculicola lignicola CBS 123094]|uniref:Zn(2)-C6 fungal-type domain-containing protein n=1 Tax=Amniculicola lignicola CBS 123094 TaxID=1392246 RepID=A0A6A5WK21_9PLEO|nr:hypothetical protein P154DRAFT_168870 [Amniculicola lignicola CBS 123094]
MDTRLLCRICKKTFTQKSSLVRHSRRCTPGPAPSLRQKACRQCTSSKTRCDLKRPKCTRCESRCTECDYIVPMTRGTRSTSPSSENEEACSSDEYNASCEVSSVTDVPAISFAEAPQGLLSTDLDMNANSPFASFGFMSSSETSIAPVYNLLLDKNPIEAFPWSFSGPEAGLLASSAQLDIDYSTTLTAPPSRTDYASDDWMLWSPNPSQTTPPLVRHSMETLLRVMKTWPKMLAKEFQTPPMLHFSHTDLDTRLQPIANCITIAKMWTGQSGGTSDVVRQTVIQEMRVLFEQYRSMDERNLLAALQSLVMYTIIIMFPAGDQISVSIVDPHLFNCLQKLVSFVARTGLMLTEERDNERPSWESWIHITAKRRAVFSLYLLHWSYSVYHCLPSFECRQLGFLPAPAPKFLWQAPTRAKWEQLYSRWLAQWKDSPYMMREFSAIQAGTALERRTEIWLEDADELGVLFFSIVNATEREPIFEVGIPVFVD